MAEDKSEPGDRIAKVIARAGICSRRDAEKLIAEGRVMLDGEIVTTPAVRVGIDQIVSVDGKAIDRGAGRDVLGHPFHPVAWLATHLAAQGTALRAGDIVMTGSVVTTKFPDQASTYVFDVTGLGAVELTIDARPDLATGEVQQLAVELSKQPFRSEIGQMYTGVSDKKP